MTTGNQFRLGRAKRGQQGVIVAVGNRDGGRRDDAFDSELERRLLEIGFVEGARVEVLHEGFLGRDPIAVKLDAMRVALRRHEADIILVREASPAATVGARS